MDRPAKTPRETLQDYCSKIIELKNHDLIHDILSEQDKDKHVKLLQELQNLSIKCFDFCTNTLPTPPIQDDEAIPSTSRSNNIVNTNTTFDEDEHFGTQNKDFLDCEFILDSTVSSGSEYVPDPEDLPDLGELNSDASDNVTHFRAVYDQEKQKGKRRKRRGKFELADDEMNCTDSDQ